MFQKSWYKYKKRFFDVSLKKLVNARLDNKILANKDKVDKDEAKSYMIADFVTSALYIFELLPLALASF